MKEITETMKIYKCKYNIKKVLPEPNGWDLYE